MWSFQTYRWSSILRMLSRRTNLFTITTRKARQDTVLSHVKIRMPSALNGSMWNHTLRSTMPTLGTARTISARRLSPHGLWCTKQLTLVWWRSISQTKTVNSKRLKSSNSTWRLGKSLGINYLKSQVSSQLSTRTSSAARTGISTLSVSINHWTSLMTKHAKIMGILLALLSSICRRKKLSKWYRSAKPCLAAKFSTNNVITLTQQSTEKTMDTSWQAATIGKQTSPTWWSGMLKHSKLWRRRNWTSECPMDFTLSSSTRVINEKEIKKSSKVKSINYNIKKKL